MLVAFNTVPKKFVGLLNAAPLLISPNTSATPPAIPPTPNTLAVPPPPNELGLGTWS